MKSLLLEAVGRLRALPMPAPEPGPDEVVLRVSHCAVCRTDAKIWHGGHRDLVLPRILGHEICAFDEKNGERFVVWPGKACGECPSCRGGVENLCRRMSILGFHRDGGYAELVAVPASSLVTVPAHLAGHLACLAEPIACTLNALEQIRLSHGSSILIHGAGVMGLLTAMAAGQLGADPHLVETNRLKFERSAGFRKRFGISGGIECNRSEFDAAINATPDLTAFSEGISKLRSNGCLCLFSGFSSQGIIPTGLINEVHYRQLHLVGAYGCTRNQMLQAVSLIQRCQSSLEPLIEDIIDLDRVPAVLPSILAGEAFKFVVAY